LKWRVEEAETTSLADEAEFGFVDIEHAWREARRRSRARQHAFRAARAGSAGKSEDEIRARYAAELRDRDVPLPHDEVLDAIAAQIAGNPLPRIRLAGEGLVQLGKLARDFHRLFGPGTGGPGE
jgi:hypothetical protein